MAFKSQLDARFESFCAKRRSVNASDRGDVKGQAFDAFEFIQLAASRETDRVCST